MKILFLYLGRSGAGVQLTLDLIKAAITIPGLDVGALVSRDNENISAFRFLGKRLTAAKGFSRATPFSLVTGFLSVRRDLLGRLTQDMPDVVVTTMPHIWTPLLARAIRRRGCRYATIIHDAVAHPGDRTGLLTPWLLSEAKQANLVVTLSKTVTERLKAEHRTRAGHVLQLFHPDLNYGSTIERCERRRDGPLRVLFFGRILAYKGLSLLIHAVELLRAEGLAVELGVAGAGDLSKGDRAALDALGAEVMNRWLRSDEIAPLLSRYDVMALPYVEASQSGVASVAFSSHMPVAAMPVGGLKEQVVDGETGVVADCVEADAFASALRRLATDPALYSSIVDHLCAQAHARSASAFMNLLLASLE